MKPVPAATTAPRAPVKLFHWKDLWGAPPQLDLWVHHTSYDLLQRYHPGDAHQHRDFYALYFVLAGRSRQVINGHSYAITRGDAYIVPPGMVHFHTASQNLEEETVFFRTTIFRAGEIAALSAMPGLWRTFLGHRRAARGEFTDYRLRLSPELFSCAIAIVEEIRAELRMVREGDASAPLVARASFFRLMAWLGRWSHDLEASETSRAGERRGLAGILQFCEEHLHEPLSVPQLAARTFLSTAHFHELFKAEVGVTPAVYLRRLRLSHAQRLLSSTTRSSSDIALSCGFRDVSQFARAFRREFNLSPRDYRRRLRSETTA